MPLDDRTTLPPLRSELQLRPAPPERDGVPRWQLRDPMRDRWFTMTEEDCCLLALWPLGHVGALRTALRAQAQVLDEDRLARLLRFVIDQQLVQADSDLLTQGLVRHAQAQQGRGLSWLLQRALGTRLVLARPQRFLEASLPWVRGFFWWPVLSVWAAMTLFGLWLVSRQWDQFTHTFAGLLSLEGALAYGAALAGLKLLHELGHGWMAVHHGVRVPHMGVSFSLGFPMLYTDTNAVHGLHDRRARLQIGLAGVGAESLVAGLATFAWAVLPDGTARTSAMVVASSSWTSSVLLNLNPLGRFDGYYLLADALRIDNLQDRARAHADWAFWRLWLGPVESPPEPVSRRRALLYTTYGSAVWLYQLLIYGGIAVLLWQFLDRLAGLAVLLLGLWLLLRPVARRMAQLWQSRRAVGWMRRAALAGLAAGTAAALAWPLDRRVQVPAVLGWQSETQLVAGESAQVLELLVRPGDAVRQGQPLLRLQSPELAQRLRELEIQLDLERLRLSRTPADDTDLRNTQVIEARVNELAAGLAGLRARMKALQLEAAADGVVADLAPELKPGRWVRANQVMGRLLHGQARDVRGLVTERELARLRVGAAGRFVPDDPSLPSLPLRLSVLDSTAVEVVSPELLASTRGGRISVREDARGRPVPQAAHVAARFQLALQHDGLPPIQLRGLVSIEAHPQSLAESAARQVGQVLLNELRQ